MPALLWFNPKNPSKVIDGVQNKQLYFYNPMFLRCFNLSGGIRSKHGFNIPPVSPCLKRFIEAVISHSLKQVGFYNKKTIGYFPGHELN